MTSIRSFLFAATLILAVASVACGSDSAPGPGASPDSDTGIVASPGDTNEFGFEVSIIANPESTYTVDDVKAVGWKSSKQLPSTTLEGASAVWFGFFQQKNLEVWIYESHADAKRLGIAPARDIVAKTRGVSGGAAGPYMKQTTQYAAFGVIGNLVVLCETEVAVCKDLAAALP